ncbi:unnamed protein product [Mucor hiemalis]
MTSTPVFAEPEELMDLVLDESKQPGRDYVIVNVRDVDYAGGHIPGAINIPANQMYDKANDLITHYKDVPRFSFTVLFLKSEDLNLHVSTAKLSTI